MSEIVLMSDPQVAAIAVQECGERLVDVRHTSSLLVDARRQDPTDAFAYLREGVLERLLDAQKRLPSGTQLLFVEGYRPPALQRQYFNKYADHLRAVRPEWSSSRIRSMASRYVSPPENRSAQRRCRSRLDTRER